jgi:hypothetical protein
VALKDWDKPEDYSTKMAPGLGWYRLRFGVVADLPDGKAKHHHLVAIREF